MGQREATREELSAKIRTLEERLSEAEQTIEAIRRGEVDALVIHKPDGEQIYTLTGADHGYRVLVESVSEGALILSSDDSIYYCNRTLGEMLQLPIQKIIGRKPDSYVAAESRAQLMKLIEESRSLRAAKGEFLIKRNDGTFLPVNVSLNSINLEAFEGVCAVITDLSEQKQVEEELRRHRTELEFLINERTRELAAARNEAIREKNRLEAVMEALPIGMAITDSRGGNIQSNAAFEQVWGSPRPPVHSVDDYTVYKAWWPDTGRAVAPEEWASARAVQRGESVVGQLFEIDRFDGSRGFVLNSASPVRDAQGNVIGSAVALQDMTDLRKVEQALRESEERFRLFMDNSPTIAWMKDEQGRHVYFNKTSENRFGVSLADWLGKTDFEVWPKETAEEFWNNDQAVLAAGHAIEVTEETINPDGSLCDWLISKFPFRDSSGRQYVAGIGLDITERKRAEKALRESEARFKLLSETAGRLLASENPQTIVNELCLEVMAHLDCHTFFNFLVDEPAGRLHLNAWGGIPEAEAQKIEWLDYGVAVCGCAARDGARIVAEDIFNTPDVRTELVKSYGIQAYACHPLMAKGRLIGTLSFGTKTRTGFSLQELEVMRTVADQVAIAMERIRLIEELQRSRDELEIRVQERTGELQRANEVLQEQANLLDLAHDAIFVRDLHDRVIYWNRGAEKTYGWTQDEARGKIADDLLQTRFPAPLQEIRAELLEAGEWEGELHHLKHNGSTIIVESRQALQRNLDGKPTGVLEINRDITKRKNAEERLHHLAAIVESSDDAIISKTLEGDILSWNKAAERIYGYAFEEVVGQPVSMLAPHDSSDELPELLAKLRSGESIAHYETVRVRKDGTFIPVSLAISLLKDAEGRMVGASTIARDITERKRAEEQLRQASQYSRSLIEASLDPLVTISPEGKITDTNEATIKLTGVPRQELIGSDFSTYFTEPEKATEGYRQVFEKGFVTDYPLTIRHQNGSLVEVLYNASVYKDTRGKVLGVFAAARDITARKQAEERIARAHAMLETVFDGISDPLLMVDKECRIRMLNEVACKYFNMANREEAIARTCSEVTLGRCGPCDTCQMSLAIREGRNANFERKGVFAPERIEQITVYPVDEAISTNSGAIVRISDITQAKVLERQLVQSEKLASLGLLVSGIAHEINNPNSFISFNIPILRDYLQELMPILDGFAEEHPNLELFSMKYQEFREDLFKLVANMEHGSSRINAIVSGLKQFVRKRDKTELRCIDLREVIEKAVNICHAEIRKKVKSFEVRIPEEVPLILTDPEVIEQVLVNFLINAVQAADKDGSWIELGVEWGRSRERYCVIEVIDNGCGMDEIIRAKIFDPFFTTKAASSGTGLGLPVCYTLVESLGGKIEVESEPGQGSIFRIVLPKMRQRDRGREELVL